MPDPADSADDVRAADTAGETEILPDPALLEAHGLALAALREITPEATIGEAAGYRVEADGVVSLRFTNRLAGYPGWFWTVSLARVEGAEPTVLEAELLPGDGALLAPEWVPWAVRLAEYHATQAALAEAARSDAHADGDSDDEDSDDDLEDVDDLDAADFDDDGSPILHAGDVDGVDIDELAEAEPDDEDDFDDELDDDEDDDSEQDDFDEDPDDDSEDPDDSEDDDSEDEDDDSEDEDDDSEDDEDSDERSDDGPAARSDQG